MVSQVVLGTFFSTSNGKTVLGGAGGSGLDTQALIKTLTDAKGAAAVRAQDQITLNDKKNTALMQFQTLLSEFRAASDALRNPPGVGNAADNVFKFTTSTIASNTSMPGGNYLTVATSPGASLQAYTISEITSLATAAQQGTSTFTVSSADASVTPPESGGVKFNPGTIVIKDQEITIDANDSLNVIAAKFNAVSETTGIAASVIKVSEGHFQLSFVATATGPDHNFDLTQGATVSDPDGVLTDLGFTAAVQGDPAIFKLNGITIERQSNTISDVVSGVTFNLLQKTPDVDTKLTVNVQPDTTTTQNSIVNFVKSYNALKTFAAQQIQLRSDGTYAETAVLANNQTFRSIMDNINRQVTAQVSGLGGSLTSLSAIGISFTSQPATADTPQVENILNVNDGQLSAALATNFSSVSKLFGFNLSSNNANLKVFAATNALTATNFTLHIDPDTETFTYTIDGGPPIALTAQKIANAAGYSLSGVVGTALEGLQLIYASDDASTINVVITQGVADKVYNTSNSALKLNTGAIAVEMQSLKDSDARLNEDIVRINDQVELYRQELLKKFGALEQSIARVNTLLASLQAQQDAANNAR